MAILSDQDALTTAASGDLLHIVDVSDTTDNAGGSSKKITADNLTAYGDSRTATLTNKTIDADNNTVTNIGTSELSDGGVTYAKIQNVSATDRLLGRDTAGAGVVEELTPAAVRTMLNIEDGADVTDATNVDSAGAVMNSDTSTAAMGFVVDEDNMASDSATKVPTQQSVKAYVDANAGGLSNVSEDTTPQLGGNLDVNGNSIVSASAGNIAITPDTTGDLILDGLKWPQADGTSGQVLKTDGAAQLSWTTPAGGGDVSKVGTPVDGQVGVWTGDGTIEGDASLTFDTTDDTLVVAASGKIAFGAVDILSDSAGTTTLQNIDAIDATTEATLESAIDSLSNLTTVGTVTSGNVDAVVSAASTTTAGKVELATNTETTTGTDTTRATTPAGVKAVADTKQDILSEGAFVDGDKTKLDGIEASADVTDATNVASAGAVMIDGSGSDITGDLVFTEKADHSSTPSAGKGYLWTKNTTPSTLIFTDDSGADTTLGSGGGIADVVDDTTPQLGGQLDVNGNAIGDGTRELITFTEDASAVNHVNIENEATGSGPIISSAGDDTNIDLNLTPKGTGAIILDGLSWPTADGTADQVLKTNGSGTLSFTDQSGGAPTPVFTEYHGIEVDALTYGSLVEYGSGSGSTTYSGAEYRYKTTTGTGTTDWESIGGYLLRQGVSDAAEQVWNFNPTFITKCAVAIGTNSNHQVLLTMGGRANDTNMTLFKAMGYRVTNDASSVVLEAYNDSTSATTTTTVSTPSLFGEYDNLSARFVCEMTSGTSIKFYVNGTLVATHTTNLPSGSREQSTNQFKIINNGTGTAKTISMLHSEIRYEAH